ncbi:hypothetical protein QBC35DRAFT_88390 [Podospora australis]|uniref:Uncharacterized protein n=1 Tax=Podospora australis TaxID=1536484 RepID=A0AAN6WZ45_9PEZI|nr:hypothetical protein QBC35DRAFT_88390 [Podospora australis]
MLVDYPLFFFSFSVCPCFSTWETFPPSFQQRKIFVDSFFSPKVPIPQHRLSTFRLATEFRVDTMPDTLSGPLSAANQHADSHLVRRRVSGRLAVGIQDNSHRAHRCRRRCEDGRPVLRRSGELELVSMGANAQDATDASERYAPEIKALCGSNDSFASKWTGSMRLCVSGSGMQHRGLSERRSGSGVKRSEGEPQARADDRRPVLKCTGPTNVCRPPGSLGNLSYLFSTSLPLLQLSSFPFSLWSFDRLTCRSHNTHGPVCC